MCKDIDNGDVTTFTRPDLNPLSFVTYSKQVTAWVGHNILGFDLWAINKLVKGVKIDARSCIDTLVISRLFNFGIDGGHSLEAWGRRLGKHKGDFKDFSQLSDEMIEYCKQDVEVTYDLFKMFEPHLSKLEWKKSLRTEHDMAVLCQELHNNGFTFNLERGKEIYDELSGILEELSGRIQSAFLPRSKLVSEVHPKLTKSGTLSRTDFRWLESGDLTPFSAGCPFSRVKWVEFNPGSPTQIVERFNEFGWKPYEKTDGHIECERELRRCRDKKRRAELNEKLEEFKVYGWKVSEGNLETLPEDAPEAAWLLVKWRFLEKRRQTLEEWFTAYSQNTSRIHGRFTHIGAWTGRMAHSNPNMGNVPSTNSKYNSTELKQLAKHYGSSMRSLWCVPKGRRLVGVDADAIQLRILAHYMNDPEFTEALVNGKKELGTDAHTLNALKLGIGKERRDNAKTWIYAWLLGAGLDKQSKILHTTLEGARESNDNFLLGYPGLSALKHEVIPSDASRGYFVGLDGRLVKCNSDHLMLAGYLQGGESTVVKMATLRADKIFKKEKVPVKIVNLVHDETEWECVDDDDVANYVALVMKESFVKIGEDLGLRCPLLGTSKMGYTWYDVH